MTLLYAANKTDSHLSRMHSNRGRPKRARVLRRFPAVSRRLARFGGPHTFHATRSCQKPINGNSPHLAVATHNRHEVASCVALDFDTMDNERRPAEPTAWAYGY